MPKSQTNTTPIKRGVAKHIRKLLIDFTQPVSIILISLIICSLLLFILGFDPVLTFSAMLRASLGNVAGLSRTLRWAAPLIMLGLSAAISFNAGVFNIGAQGQFWVGAFAAVWVGLTFPELPKVMGIPFAFLLAAGAGGIWGAIPGWLRARFGPRANEVISTLMMNYIAFQLTNFLVRVPFADPHASGLVMATKPIDDTLQLPYVIGGTQLTISIFIAILLCVAAGWFLRRYTLGYEIKIVGANPWFAETSGINVRKTIIMATTISGIIAGIAGASEAMGAIGRFVTAFGADLGFNGITASIIANNNPVGIIASGLFFGALRAGSLAVRITTDTPRAIVATLEGLIVFLITARWFIRKRRKRSNSQGETEKKGIMDQKSEA